MTLLAHDGPFPWPEDWEVSCASNRVALFTLGRDGLRWANTREAKRHLAATADGPRIYAAWETRLYLVPRWLVARDLGLGSRVRA